MVSPALIDWIKRQETKGYTSQQIYLHLVNNGYDQKDVIEAVNMSNAISGNYPGSNVPYTSQNISNNYQNNGQQNNNHNNSRNETGSHESHKGMWIFLIFLIILGAGGFYIYSSGMYVPAIEFVDEKLGTSIGMSLGITNTDVDNNDNLQNEIIYQNDGVSSGTDSNTVVVQDPNSGIIVTGEPTVSDVLNSQSDNSITTSSDSNCDSLSEKLVECANYNCEFFHPITGEPMIRELELIGDTCKYTEQMPNGGSMECNYDETYRIKVSEEYALLAQAEKDGKEVTTRVEGNLEESNSFYTIDGVEYTSSITQALNDGTCVILGYD